MFALFLIYIYLHMIACSDLNISGICPAIVDAKNTSQKVGIHLNCCPNFHVENNICTPCPAGWYGKKCKEKCLSNYYGNLCKQMCNCSLNETCNNVYGCICNDSSNCSDRENMYKSKTYMFNGYNDTLPTTMNIWTTEGYSTFRHIHVYLISVSAAMVLVCLATAFIRIIRSTRKGNGLDSANYKRKRNGRTTYPVSRGMKFSRSQYAVSSGACRMFTERTQNQFIEV